MPGKVKVKIIAGRNLPVMDRSSDTTDAYVEIKLGNTTYKTDVCRKSLNPQWNSEWYRFEVDDSELQDEPLQIRLMDHDTYSANDAIGKVYMNLNPLLIPAVALPGKYGWGGDTNVDQPSSSVMSGWIPVYDTMHGIRGEVNVTVKVELFSDFNKFRQSSCGVQFFCSPAIPHGYHAQVIHGFIEELVVNDDPEYQWIDKIRTPRASNEARQTLFFKLSGELQRKIGVKALDLGGNAVIGYNQCFDLEGESGIVARGIGTVVTLVKHHEMQQQLDIGIAEEKALSYLKFLAFDNGLRLDNDNIFERFTLSSPIPNTSIFVSTPDNPNEQLTRISPKRNIPIFLRQSSQPLIEYEPLPHNLKTSISSRSLSDDIREEIALRQLLRQEEMKGGSSMSLSRKIKYLKQNMLSKKMNTIKSKLTDSEMQESLNLDTASISSRGDTNSIRTSLIDLRELRKKKKQNNSSYMAELLVRSVMHVHTSLDCIVECHDSGPPHASSTSELSEQLEENSSHQSSESQDTVLEVAPGTSYINKTISEPYLLLPDNTMVSPSSNVSSDSDMSSSDGSDSPSEIKDDNDKLDFDTISLIVKNVQNEEKHEHKEMNPGLEFSYLDPRIITESNVVIVPINDSSQISATAPVLQSDDSNLFVFPLDNENKIEQFGNSAILSTDRLEPKKTGHLSRTLSRSCTDIAVDNKINTDIDNDMNSAESYNIVPLPTNMEKRIENLRFSALFKSIAERPKTKLSKTFSISHEDISTSNTETNENIVPPSKTIHLAEPERKRKMSKAFSISCEEIYSPNIAELEKRIEKLRKSALFSSGIKKAEPIKKGKLTRTFSVSSEKIIDQEKENKSVMLPINIDKKIETLFQSPLFSDTGKLEPRRGKMSRALSRSCADISSPNKNEMNNENKNLLSANAEKRIGMFKNSPLFKISIMTEPKVNEKITKELSTSSTDISALDKDEIIQENKNLLPTIAEKRIGMFKNSPLFKISIMAEPKTKGKLTRELSRSCADMFSPDKDEINEENKNLLPATAEKRIDMFKNSPLFKISIMGEPNEKGKMTRELSSSYTDVSSPNKDELNEENKNLLPTTAEKRIGMFKNSPLFKISIMAEPKAKGKMTRELSRSCTDVSSPNKDELNEENKNLLPTTAEKRIGMFKNSPLFKISIMAEPKAKGKMTRKLSRSYTDVSSPNKDELNEENKNLLPTTAEKRIGMFKNSSLFKISIMAEPKAKGKMTRELSRSCSDFSSPENNEINEENKDVLSANIEKRIDMFKNSPLFKISIITEPKKRGKMNKELSRSHTDITATDKYGINTENNSKSNPDLSDAGLVNTAMQTILTEKINLLSSQPVLISPRAQDQLCAQNDPNVGNYSLVKTAMQTMLMEKIDLMTAHQAPVSKRVKEEFQKSVANSFSKSDPDLRSHIKSTVNKIHFPIKSPSFLRKSRGDHTGSLKYTNFTSDPDVRDYNSVKSLLIDKIHLLASKSPSLSRKFNGDSHKEDIKSEPHSPEVNSNSLVNTAMQTILMEKVNILTPPIPSNGEREFVYTKQENVPTTPEQHYDSSSWTPEQHYMFEQPDDIENKHNNLFKSAMQTMLMDKLNIMAPSSPPVSSTEEEPNFHAPKVSKHPNLAKIKTSVHHAFEKVHILSPKHTDKKCFNDDSEPSLMKTAMQTMLIDKVHIMAPDASPQETKEEEYNYDHTKPSSPKHHDHPNLDKVKSAVHTVLDKVTHPSPKSPTSPKNDKKFDFGTSHESEPSLMKTAMQTMLFDKIHIMAPDASPAPNEEKEYNYDHTKPSSPKHHDHSNVEVKSSPKSPTSPKTDKKFDFYKESEPSLMRTAMQTMLIDKVHIMAPDASPQETEEEEYNCDHTKPSSPKHHDHPNLDKVKSVVHNVLDKVTHSSQKSPTSPKTSKTIDFGKDHDAEPSLMRTAMQTMLIDKVNILAPDAPSSVVEEEFEDSKQSPTKNEIKHEQLNLDKVKSTVHSVLDKVQNLSSPTKEKKFDYSRDQVDEENPSLMKTAMQTMLLDKVNIIAPSSPQISPESQEFQFDQNSRSLHGQKAAVSDYTQIENYDTSIKSATLSHPVVEQPISSNTQSSSRSDIGKKHSIFGTIKKKCKSLKSKMSFSKLIHKKDSSKEKVKEDGLIGSAMTTILLDKVNSIQGTLSSTDEEILQPKSESPSSSVPMESPPKAYNKEKLDDITLSSACTEEPNILIRPDSGVSCNRSTAVTADDANCNTNAEHAPCLYTSDRRIVESPVPSSEKERERDRESVRESRERHGHQRTESTGGKMSQSPARLNAIPCIHRRSSDSDLSITPKGNSLTGSDRSGGTIPGYHHIRSTLLRPTVDNFDMMEYPFLTMSKYPPGFILHLGGAVSARSVKLLERITNIEEPETRDTWWSEIRMEIRTHARALNCNAVLGYTESTSICDEVCVLSASGTAAVIALYSGELSDGVSGLPNLHKPHVPNKDLMTSSLDRTDFERDKNNTKHPDSSTTNNRETNKITQVTESPEQEATIEFSGATSVPSPPTSCRICHIPYSESTMSFRINMLYCSICKLAKVPDILLTTIEMPEGLPITGRGCFLQSYVCRPKRDLKGELNAKEISESLPFLEYELHRLLVNKMKVKAMNTIFGLKVRITIGERMLIGIATGTAVFLLPLPPPPLPKLIAGNATTEDKRLAEMQKLLVDTVKKNKEIYELKDIDVVQPIKLISDTEESDEEKSNLDLGAGNKDSCVLEVDDSEDIEVINLLVEPRPPDGFHVVNTENVPGLEELEIVRNLQMFTQVWRAKIPLNQSASHFGKHFQKLLQSVYFKLRRMIPCALCDLQFRVDLPEPDEIQLTLLGMALGLGDPMKLNKFKRKNLCHLPAKELIINKKSDDELIFSLEEDHIPENSIPVISQGSLLNPQMPKHRQKSPQRLRVNTKQRHTPIKERHGVDITPLSYVPGGKIERYLGYLNFFFIRETTSIREGGGLSGFVHSFITEVLAIVRAHVTALGGNAMVAYFMTECVLYHNAHKNQGQCLINVGGDVVFVSYFTEDN